MKKQMLVAAVIMTAALSAQASKARLNALGNSEHIVDIQEVFQSEPDQALNYEAATVEFGSATATQEAEGGFIRKMGDSAWSLYLGRSSTTFKSLTDTFTGLVSDGTGTETANLRTGFIQANPLQLTYGSKSGDINWGAGLFMAMGDKTAIDTAEFDATSMKTNIMGLLIGANNGTWDAQARIGLVGEMTADGAAGFGSIANLAGATELEMKSTSSLKVSGGYAMDSMYFFGGYEMGAGEVTANSTTAIDREATSSAMTVGVVNSHKKDGVDFFYGVSAVISNVELKNNTANTKAKTDATTVPLLVGVEAEVSSWLTLRGSLTQPLALLSSSKSTGGKAGSLADNTVTALGAGFKWGKATIDTVIETGTTGNFGTDGGTGDIFGQASVTYNF